MFGLKLSNRSMLIALYYSRIIMLIFLLFFRFFWISDLTMSSDILIKFPLSKAIIKSVEIKWDINFVSNVNIDMYFL